MKLLYAFLILIFVQSCSFDNKTGIWNSQDSTSKEEKGLFEDFERLYATDKSFNKIIPLEKNFKFELGSEKINTSWNDIFFAKTNNLPNFKYNDTNQIILKSKKLTRHNPSKYILFEQNNLIFSDDKGNIIIFSIKKNKVLTKFNFYKNQFKNIKKKLNLIVEKNIVFVADNIGFLYAYDFETKSVLWAKNFKTPFRSNLKLLDGKIVAASQNNNLFFFNKKTGEIIKKLPTEETLIKNQFINNLSWDDKSLFFINTYGTLYSINSKNLRVNWFLNLNQSIDLNPSNLFFGSEIVIYKNKIVISANQFTYVIDSNTGTVLSKKNFYIKHRPLILKNYLFLITNNNLLISLDLKNLNILYSQNINQQVAEFLKIKKKEVKTKNIIVAKSKIFIFLTNSYILKYNMEGKLEEVRKPQAKMRSQPILINGSLLFINNKNKLVILN